MEDKEFTVIKHETIKLNDAVSKRLSLISVTIKNANTRKLKRLNASQSLELPNEYWSLLKKTKTKIKSTKDAVDMLLAVCVKWNEILLLHNDAQALNKNQKEYISDYVPQQFDEYFTEDFDELQMVQSNWTNFNTKVARSKVKTTETAVSDRSGSKQMICNTSTSIIGCVGILFIIGGALAFPFSSSGGIHALGVILIVVGVVLFIYGIYRGYQQKSTNEEVKSAGGNVTDKDYHSLDDVEQDETKEEKVAFLSDMDKTPPPSFKTLEPMFNSLRQQIKEEKLVKELQDDVAHIVESIKKLQDICKALMQQITSAQDAHK